VNEVTLEERMERLERQNRRLRLAVVGVLAAVTALAARYSLPSVTQFYARPRVFGAGVIQYLRVERLGLVRT